MAKVLVDQDFLEDGLELICNKVRLKTGGTGVLAFPVEIASAVESIETGSGGITPTGTKEITENGTYDVTSFASAEVTVPTGTDTTDANAVAADLASGKTAYVNGVKITGTQTERSSTDLVTVGAQVTVPAGLYRTDATKSVASATQATPSVTVNSSTGLVTASATQTAGYVAAGTKTGTLQLTAKSAQTFTPGTSDQGIPAGRYLTGKQTIKGDARLVAVNIKKDVVLFGVTGTYEGNEEFLRTVHSLSTYGSTTQNQATIVYPNGEDNVKGIFLFCTKDGETMNYTDIVALLVMQGGSDSIVLKNNGGWTRGDFTISMNSTGCTITSTDPYFQFLSSSNYVFSLISA